MHADHLVEFDASIPLATALGPGHNRWHPDVPPLVRIAPGETIALDLRDGFDGHITPESQTEDLLDFDRRKTHPMTGPIFIEGAEPGDHLVVEILEIEPAKFGATCVMPTGKGGVKGGFLSERFPGPFLVKWHVEGGFARSDELPGVAIPAEPFLGLIGVAPSIERLRSISKRELDLSERGAPVRLPDPEWALPGEGRPATEGLRTRPPRETGGNLDVKSLTKGARITLPVDVPGALCSVGDAHLAQGDGESCGTAIEISARAYLRFDVIKSSGIRWRPRNPTMEFVETATRGTDRRFMATMGFPVSEDGRNEYLDLNLATSAALSEMVAYLTEIRGFTDYQAYVLVSVAVDLRLSQIVCAPNAVVSAVLPLDIFE